MTLHEAMPDYDVREYHQTAINASREEVYRTMKTMDFRASEIVDYSAPMHHNQPVTQCGGLMHRMGHHQSRQLVARYHLLCQRNHLIGTARIEGRCVLVEQQQIGLAPRGH